MDHGRLSRIGKTTRWGVWAIAALVVAVLPLSDLLARSGGINGFSGNPATNGGAICNQCHSGGQTPQVSLDGPTLVAPGTVHTYTLTIMGGQEVAGGLDVSATSGTLVVTDPGTQMKSGEITHTSPRPVDGNKNVTFSFNWTAPVVELLSFNPGSRSFFFVVVGRRGADEGSYGTDLLGGINVERPAFAGNTCGQVQVLNDRCD